MRYLFELTQKERVDELVNSIRRDLNKTVTIINFSLNLEFGNNYAGSVINIYKRKEKKMGPDAMISEFPGQCSWIVVSSLPYEQDSLKDVLDVVEYIANKLGYSHVLLSHYTGKIKEFATKNGYVLLQENLNKHSDNIVYLLSKEIMGDFQKQCQELDI